MSEYVQTFHKKLYARRFELLLASLLCVFVLNIFFPDDIYGGAAQAVYLPVQLLAALTLFESKRHILRLALVFALFLVISRALDIFFAQSFRNEMLLLYICFFGSVMLEVFRQIYKANLITAKIVYAAICGFLLIGYCGFYVFLAIEMHRPGSFNGLGQGPQVMNDLFYFSYVTILTIGYGDITPNTWIAKNATVLVALVAYIYSLVVIAAIVGQAVRNKNNRASGAGQPSLHTQPSQRAQASQANTHAPASAQGQPRQVK